VSLPRSLQARIAQQAEFIRLLKRNGSAVLATIGQDVLKDLRRSRQAARKEMEQYNLNATLPTRPSGPTKE
jgi:hypothetical protein